MEVETCGKNQHKHKRENIGTDFNTFGGHNTKYLLQYIILGRTLVGFWRDLVSIGIGE